MDDPAVARNTERAVLTVLSGTPLSDAAHAEGVEPADLAEAVEIYRRAGRHALDHHTATGWWQLYIQFTDWNAAEQTAADHLAPMLHDAEGDGVITAWWFMRKHPLLAAASAPRTRRAHDATPAGGGVR